MRLYLSMLALCAGCLLLSGCGCSKEKTSADGVSARMKDVAYTNQLTQIHRGHIAVANRAAALRAKIAKMGKDREKNAEYTSLTNELAKCEAQAAQMRRDAMATVRARILKDAAKKGNLKK
ncbi:MAG: hypothetical protein IJV91_07590 [Kiritimatiellae bacterium]|nr:hypothetical protein [Kiritimatiellia bacterium]